MPSMIFSTSRVLPWLLIAPNLAIAIVCVLIPTGRLLIDAFAPTGVLDFTPLATLLTDPQFGHIMTLTTALGGCVTLTGTAIGLCFSLLLANTAHAGLYRNALIWPYAVAAPIAGVLWLALTLPMFDGDPSGPLPRALTAIGWQWPQTLSGLETMALIATVCAWRQTGLAILLLTAALTIPSPTLYEAARLDGVPRRQQFFLITLPSIRPTLWLLLIGGFLSTTFESFGVTHSIILSGAAGTNATPSLLIHHIFLASQTTTPAPDAALQSVVLLTMTAALMWTQWRLFAPNAIK
ncbi:putative sn-glycerol-3-phosphate ABC transporter permease UgpA [Azospirillaceae bacterium]